jgi:hypothetical protein
VLPCADFADENAAERGDEKEITRLKPTGAYPFFAGFRLGISVASGF